MNAMKRGESGKCHQKYVFVLNRQLELDKTHELTELILNSFTTTQVSGGDR